MSLFSKPFEVRLDGELVSKYRTYKEAQAATVGLLERGNRYSVDERVGSRLFNKAFGYNAGTTSTADLARMGVPIHSSLAGDERKM
jgi:hypothetical protein